MSTKIWGTIWNFIVTHWQVLVLATVVVVGVNWWKNRNQAATIAALNAANQAEVTTINKALSDEQAAHAAEVQQLQTSLDQIQQQYVVAQQQLVAQEAQEQAQIVKQYGNDPTGLANLLAGKMGFKVQ